jgi:YspA, cpYpsA-related SLOG family
MKVIIAGSRNFNNYELLKEKCDKILSEQKDVEIVCGMAKGADLLGKQYQEEKGYQLKEFPAEWDKFGKSAGYIRNEEMAKYSDSLIAFWDGKSKGTKHMIDLAEKYKLKIRIIKY